MKKNKLVFACHWDREKEKSWSGTKYAIYSCLANRYEIEEFEIKYSLKMMMQKVYGKLAHSGTEPAFRYIEKKYNSSFQEKYKEKSPIVFQFDEFPLSDTSQNYIYQDMCVNYILDMKEKQPEVFAKSNFADWSEEELLYRKKMQEEFYAHCQAVFCMGNWLADYLVSTMKVPKEKVFTVGAGTNVRFTEGKGTVKKERNKILFVGKDFERKGGKVVVEAFQILKNAYMPTAKLYIAGPEKNPLNEAIEGIQYLGNLSYDALIPLFEECDIFCMPSYFEAYGIVFAEALTFGLPCIARNCFAMPELIQHGKEGYLIENDDSKQLAEYMNQLLHNEDIFEYVQERKGFYQKEYSWENVAEKIDLVMQQKSVHEEMK